MCRAPLDLMKTTAERCWRSCAQVMERFGEDASDSCRQVLVLLLLLLLLLVVSVVSVVPCPLSLAPCPYTPRLSHPTAPSILSILYPYWLTLRLRGGGDVRVLCACLVCVSCMCVLYVCLVCVSCMRVLYAELLSNGGTGKRGHVACCKRAWE